MSKYLNTNDPEILESTYQTYLQTTDRKPWPNTAGMRLGIDEIAKRTPAAKGKLVDMLPSRRRPAAVQCRLSHHISSPNPIANTINKIPTTFIQSMNVA